MARSIVWTVRRSTGIFPFDEHGQELLESSTRDVVQISHRSQVNKSAMKYLHLDTKEVLDVQRFVCPASHVWFFCDGGKQVMISMANSFLIDLYYEDRADIFPISIFHPNYQEFTDAAVVFDWSRRSSQAHKIISNIIESSFEIKRLELLRSPSFEMNNSFLLQLNDDIRRGMRGLKSSSSIESRQDFMRSMNSRDFEQPIMKEPPRGKSRSTENAHHKHQALPPENRRTGFERSGQANERRDLWIDRKSHADRGINHQAIPRRISHENQVGGINFHDPQISSQPNTSSGSRGPFHPRRINAASTKSPEITDHMKSNQQHSFFGKQMKVIVTAIQEKMAHLLNPMHLRQHQSDIVHLVLAVLLLALAFGDFFISNKKQ